MRRDWLWLIGAATGISLVQAVVMVADAADQLGPFTTPWDAVAAAAAYWGVYQVAIILRRRWPGSRHWDGIAVAVSVGGAAFAYGTAGALFRGDDRGLAFLALAGAYLALTALVWRIRIGTRDLLAVFWAAGLTAGTIGALILLRGDVLVVVLALNGALQVALARRLGEPRLQLSAAAHIARAAWFAIVAAPPANLVDFPATGLTRDGLVSGDLVLSADLSAIAVAAALTIFWLQHLPSYIWSASEVRRATSGSRWWACCTPSRPRS